MISIHALREEGDQVKPIFVVADLISIHALREEGDPTCSQMARRNVLFLSTPSARRATWPLRPAPQPAYHFYPRPPRGGRLDYLRRSPLYTHFYPRPPRGGRHRRSGKKTIQKHFYPRPPRGGRQSGRAGNNPDKRFLSTPSARRATHLTMLLSSENHISIHALREEGDKDTEGQKQQMNIFLSTPSARRATSSKKPR